MDGNIDRKIDNSIKKDYKLIVNTFLIQLKIDYSFHRRQIDQNYSTFAKIPFTYCTHAYLICYLTSKFILLLIDLLASLSIFYIIADISFLFLM